MNTVNAVVDSSGRIELSRSEVLKLCAIDDVFYCRQMFPRTFRQKTPEWHRDYWFHFNDTTKDLFGAEIFRGGAKTTLTRAGISKRIGFGVSRNILSIAISETMAANTVRWIKRQIENQSYWCQLFELRKGDKWTDDWIEVINTAYDMRINLVARGITGSIRGLNFDDYRPDFIVADDISNEETTGTEDQREKYKDLFFGTIVPAMAPKSEAPERKLVLNQTALHKEDIISLAHSDPAFFTVRYPKLLFDAQTGAPLSAWEERYPLQEVLKERTEYIRRKQYHVWLREYGCKIISKETSAFDPAWLRYWKALPTNLRYFIGIDPASDSKKKEAHKSALAIIGVSMQTGDVYLADYYAQQGKNPEELWTWLITRLVFFRPEKVGVETVAFQKMLAWYFRQKMQENNRYFVISEFEDRRSKPDRIRQALSGLASNGKFWVSENHTEFVSGFTDFQDNVDWDLGDAAAIAICQANPWMIQAPNGDGQNEDEAGSFIPADEVDIPEIDYMEGAP